MGTETRSTRKNAPKGSRTAQRFSRQKTIRVRLARLGAKTQVLALSPGTTVKDLVKAQGLERLSVRLNGNPVRLATELRDQDALTVVLPFIAGASTGRYDHLDLERYRRTMLPRDFDFFVNFVGADQLGLRDEDLQAC